MKKKKFWRLRSLMTCYLQAVDPGKPVGYFQSKPRDLRNQKVSGVNTNLSLKDCELKPQILWDTAKPVLREKIYRNKK